MTGPNIPIAVWADETKYREQGEEFNQKCGRIAGALSDNQEHYDQCYDILKDQRFLPGGRVQSAAGSARRVTAFNCFRGDTEILTYEYGLVPISEIVGKSVTLMDQNGSWVKDCPVRSYGEQSLMRVNLRGGYNKRERKTLYVTPDHKWVLNNRVRTETINLREKDELWFTKPARPTFDKDYISGVQHGIIYGDGTETASGFHARLCGVKTSLSPFFQSALWSVTNPPSYEGDIRVSTNQPFRSMKNLPNGDEPYGYLKGFVNGWLATDGCVDSRDMRVMLAADEYGLAWIKEHGPKVGFEIKYATRLSSKTNYGVRNKDIYNIVFDKNLISEYDILNEKHKSIFREVQYLWVVESVERTDLVEEVFCPTVITTSSVQLANGVHSGQCFVMQKVPDDFMGIMKVATDAGQTMRLGGGVGYDFSDIRPRNELIKSLDSRASGPVSFMGIMDAICKTIASAGHRRGAQMATLRVDHPDIEEFVTAKNNKDNLTQFNMSILVTDAFMEAVKEDKEFDLVFGGRVYKTIRAKALWDKIMRSTWDWAEPGVIFIDRINQMNNLWYVENISATNPCGEQPLPPYGACLLGSFNLTKYVRWRGDYVFLEKGTYFDWVQFLKDIPVIVRMMDNVIDETIYPLHEQEQEAKNKRRMGLGITGLANVLGALGIRYGSKEAQEFTEDILYELSNECYKSSAYLAKMKGSFPLYNKDKYARSKFIQKLPPETQELIRKYGIRNSHLTSIAPTGTISLTANNVSSGIEPVFSLEYTRTVQTADGPMYETVQDYALREWGIECVTADKITAQEHVAMLNAAQKWVDSSVSKTCNIGDEVSFEEFKEVYMMAYDGGAKGCTTFRASGKRFGILNASASEDIVEEKEQKDETQVEGGACYIDIETGIRTCDM